MAPSSQSVALPQNLGRFAGSNSRHFSYDGSMEEKYVIKALAALAQPNRLLIFRSLVVKGSAGLTPAMIAEALGMPANTLSFHLKELLNADLISQERSGRHLIYRAQYDRMNAVLSFLSQNCCRGEVCEVSPEEICKNC
jgi:DNA-binding transcriptional ArsR family regulator